MTVLTGFQGVKNGIPFITDKAFSKSVKTWWTSSPILGIEIQKQYYYSREHASFIRYVLYSDTENPINVKLFTLKL